MKNIRYLKTIAALLFILWGQQGLTQTKNVDSLYAIWSDTTNSPELRVEAFYQRFNRILYSDTNNPETARWAYGIKEVQRLAQQIGRTNYEARFIFLESSVYLFMTGEMEKCCPLAIQAFEKALEYKDFEIAWFALSTLSICTEKVPAFFDMDIEQLDIRLSKKIDLESFHVNHLPYYFYRGIAHYDNSRFPEALIFFQKFIAKSEEHQLQDDSFYAESLTLTGDIHHLTKNLDDAESYLLKATHFAKKSKNENVIGGAYISLAQLYVTKGNINRATSCLDTALLVMKGKQHCETCLNKAYRVKASINNLEGNHQEALQELQKLEPLYNRQINNGAYYTELGLAYLGLQEYQKAISACETGIQKTNKLLFSSVDSYKVIYEAYQAMGKPQQALQSYQKYITARDSITELRNAQKVTRQELAFQYEQKRLTDSLRQEIVFQKEINRQKSNRNILLVLGLLAVFLALGIYTRYRFVQKTKVELEKKNKIIEIEKEKAEASERAKHQFLANMSHEIRTPMNAIKGMTDILIRRDPKAEQKEYLFGIKQSSDSLLVIINDILDISKIESGKIELEQAPFFINKLVNNVHTIMQFKAEEKGLELKKDIPKETMLVKGDATRLRQILINLIGNAIKFTEKGVVTTKVKSETINGKVNLNFTISDTGIGIDEDRLDKIFKSFEQAYSDTSRKFGGTGLGLSISKKLVELHGGTIWGESQKGKGSQFHFTIPYEVAESKSIATAHEPVAENNIAGRLKGINILLVEDNQFNAIVAQEELEDAIESVHVEVAENGAIAVEKLKTSDYDVLLMDVQMPKMNGYEATKAIRAMTNNKAKTPIIAMTANVMKEEVDACYKAGMDDFIGKPFDTENLLKKMLTLLHADLNKSTVR